MKDTDCLTLLANKTINSPQRRKERKREKLFSASRKKLRPVRLKLNIPQ